MQPGKLSHRALADLLATLRGAPDPRLVVGPRVGEDAAVVRRLRDVGAVVLGLTTLNEFALGTTGVNPHGRTARNP